MSWYQVPTETSEGNTLIPHPPGPEYDPEQCYYELAAGQLVLEFWKHCSAFMGPFLFMDTLASGLLIPPYPDGTEEQLNEVRQQITQRYLEAWGREPAEEEWEVLYQLAKISFVLPDGTTIGRARYLSFMVEMWETCDGALPPQLFMKLLVQGLTPENIADLSPKLVEYFAAQRQAIETALTAERDEPPTYADWMALAKLLASEVVGPRPQPL